MERERDERKEKGTEGGRGRAREKERILQWFMAARSIIYYSSSSNIFLSIIDGRPSYQPELV